MATTNTGTTNFDKAVVTLVRTKLEEELRAPLPHLSPGSFIDAEFVQGSNNTMRFLRVADMGEAVGEYATPSAGTAPWLTEGTPPDAEAMSLGYEEFSAHQAGRVLQITDKAILQHPVKLIAKAADLVVRNALETADRRISYVINNGANVLLAGSRARRDLIRTTDVLTATLLRRAVANLKSDNVPTFGDGYYRAFINPAVSFDFMEDTGAGGWMEAAKYAGSMPLLKGELGRFAGVRFIESSATRVFVPAGATTEGGSGTPITVTTSAAADDIIDTTTAHGFVAGDKVKFTALTGGTGLTVDTVYFVIAANLAAQTFQVSATAGGAAINFSADITAGTVALANNVYSTFIHGPEAYAFGDWGELETHLTPPGGHDDPLHQSALVGWKGYFGAMLVGEGDNATNAVGPRYIRIESGSGL